jgi:tricorn protease
MTQQMQLNETLLLKQPVLQGGEIVFLYAGDLWIVQQNGQHPRRLTAQKGPKIAPSFSPDGAWIAFSANYDGNLSVYGIPRAGGTPRRLTYHPYDDLVRGWTPDGKQVLFSSSKETINRRVRHLYTVSLEGGLPERLPMPMADRGAYSPDGQRIAYTPFPEGFWSWKRYRGGMTTPIWIMDLKTYEAEKAPHENASDTFPCWLGETLYFLSDRNHTMNVFRWQPGSDSVEQVTFHDDFDVRSLSVGDGQVIYEQGGRVHLYHPDSGQSEPLSITVTADLPYTRPHYEKAAAMIQNAGISPTGQRAVFEARGDIFTVPVKKGEVRNITHTPGVSERYPAWSPDGQSIAYFSDASGEYQLVVSDQKGTQQSVIALGKQSFFYSPIWSPDSKKIAFTDKALNLSWVDLETRQVTRVDTEPYDHVFRTLNPSWSPDSQWLVYTRRLDSHIRAVFLYHLGEKTSYQVTDGMSDATDACFSQDGKYLFFAASTNFGLNTAWLDMSSFERPINRTLYVVVLKQAEPSPLAPETDEEKLEEGGAEGDEKAAQPADKAEKKKPVEVQIDLQGLDQRILALPLPARNYHRLKTAQGKLFYLEILANQPLEVETEDLASQLGAYDLKERKSEVWVDKAENYWVSADGKKILYKTAGEPSFFVVGVEKKPDAGEGKLNLDGMEVQVDPRAEWRQIFREAFRIHRDFFYDAAMQGLDLEAAYQKYLPFLEHVGHRDDLNYLLAEFSGELVVGHAYVRGGDVPAVTPVPVGLLGADYSVDANGYYRFSHIYAGVNWHPELRAPLTEPGVNVQEGEYLLAVNGQPLRAPENLYHRFEKTADHLTELLVGPSPDPKEARTVIVRPIGNETALRQWNWVEQNRKKVADLSQGRVAYVYMPDTAVPGYEAFNRYYFSQLDKEAVVLDERLNGGGMVADYVIDLLNRPLLSYWATREGKPFLSPNASIFGPKVMIINELSGSGGDAMPLFFRRRGLGKLVGKRTWGGLIGIYDYPPLMDGGFFTSPRMAIYSPQGEWEVENEGVAPDIEVEMTPKEMMAGHDAQLERAVAEVLAELEAAPFVRAARPASAKRAAA